MHIVSLSGGVASAIAADRVLQKYGNGQTELFFTDTSWEDPDLYRFLNDLEEFWRQPITRHQDGRTPPEIFEEESIIGSNRFLSCTRKLKIKPFVSHVKTKLPCTVYLGLDWTETHRIKKPKERYQKLGALIDFPLLWEPKLLKRDYIEVVKSWGIEIPEMYRQGFSHNNCGGSCFRQGAYAWKKLQQINPSRFNWMMKWEKQQQKKVGPHTILKNKSLADLQFDVNQPALSGLDDEGCFCAW